MTIMPSFLDIKKQYRSSAVIAACYSSQCINIAQLMFKKKSIAQGLLKFYGRL
jgi:hypothetical protein